MILDEFVPEFSFSEQHSIRVTAPPRRLFEVLNGLTPAQVPLSGFLMRVRALPALLLHGERYGENDHQPFLRQPSQFGFILLGEKPEKEIVLGAVGQFWKPTGGICRELEGPTDFVNFSRPGYVKVGWNFFVEEGDSSCVLHTETRIAPTDPASRRKFGLYWVIVRPGSGLIRRAILKTVKRLSEEVEQ